MSALDRDKATYKSLSLATGIVAGALTGAAFTRVWRVVSDDEAPEPTALKALISVG